VQPADLKAFMVVRVADEVVVDLMASACGMDYEAAKFLARFMAEASVDE
jgi:hypothetical protein